MGSTKFLRVMKRLQRRRLTPRRSGFLLMKDHETGAIPVLPAVERHRIPSKKRKSQLQPPEGEVFFSFPEGDNKKRLQGPKLAFISKED
jgi:hypothetical protein